MREIFSRDTVQSEAGYVETAGSFRAPQGGWPQRQMRGTDSMPVKISSLQ